MSLSEEFWNAISNARDCSNIAKADICSPVDNLLIDAIDGLALCLQEIGEVIDNKKLRGGSGSE